VISRTLLLAIAPLALFAFAADQGDRVKLIGNWQLEGSGANESDLWTIEGNGDTLHMIHSNGTQKLAEFDCNTVGRDCETKESGKPAKISLWFSGPKLVVLETKGAEVVKREFLTGAKGDTLELTVIPVVPDGKTETQHFRRTENSVSSVAAGATTHTP
jgi:hypothetical protein